MAITDKILVPTDFSNNAWKALVFASKIQEHNQADIVILHAFSTYYSGFQSPSDNQDQYDSQLAEALENIDGLRARIEKELPNLNYEIVAKGGILYNAVKELQETTSFSTICMGTKGASGLQAALIGSQTFEIGKRVDLPLVIVPEAYESTNNKEVTFLSDYGKNDAGAVQLIEKLLQPEQINVVHLTKKVTEGETNKLAQHVQKLALENTNISSNLISIDDFSTEEGILGTIKANDWSLIAINPIERNFFESLFTKSFSKPLIHHSNVPILLTKV